MNLDELKSQVALGEDSRRQFKQDMTNTDSLAAEMAAFSNAEGGVIYLGVADDGSLPGLSRADVARLNQLIANNEANGSEKSSEKSSEKILGLLRNDPTLSARQLAETIGISQRAVEKQIARLREQDRLRRIGPAKGGYWEVIE